MDFDAVESFDKISRSSLECSSSISVKIRSVPDFVRQMVQIKRPEQRIVAFAAEVGNTETVLARAENKLMAKGADWIVANPVCDGLGPEASMNEVWVIHKDGSRVHFPKADKSFIAVQLCEYLGTHELERSG
jgi:phosphopantothenoylcysteine decarboxylase/phosphopantothenate--cysteine ligase